MIIISALHPWVEAQDQSCKGSKEIQKSATASLLTKFRSHNLPLNKSATLRKTPVIYLQRKYQHTLYQDSTHRKTPLAPPLLAKTPARSYQREARVRATQGGLAATCPKNSRRRKAERPAQNSMQKKMKSFTGQATNKKTKIEHITNSLVNPQHALQSAPSYVAYTCSHLSPVRTS